MNIVIDSVVLDGLLKTLQSIVKWLPDDAGERSDADRTLGYLRGVFETAHRSQGSAPHNPLERPLRELCNRMTPDLLTLARDQSVRSGLMLEHWAKEGREALDQVAKAQKAIGSKPTDRFDVV